MTDPQIALPTKPNRHLALLRELVASGAGGGPPVARLVGFWPVAGDVGTTTFEMDAGPQHANPMGTLHGGVVCDLADAAMGMAMATTLDDDESFTTLELTSKFVKPIWTARLRATAKVYKRTRTLGLIDCDVTDPSGSLVARVSSTCMVLRGDKAQGR